MALTAAQVLNVALQMQQICKVDAGRLSRTYRNPLCRIYSNTSVWCVCGSGSNYSLPPPVKLCLRQLPLDRLHNHHQNMLYGSGIIDKNFS